MKLLKAKFGGLTGNVRLVLIFQPLWTIPLFLYNSYAVLYMMKLGVSGEAAGLINSLSFAVKTVAALFAGYIINRIGRKRSLVIFDAISWIIPYFILAFATNFLHFLVANLVNSLVIVNAIAWQCYLVEDVKPEDRIHVYNILEVITISCGFFTPLAGLLVNKLGLVPALRGIYFFAFVLSVIFVLLKLVFLKETSIGQKIKDNDSASISSFITGSLKAAKYILKKRMLLILMILSIIYNFNLIISNLFYFPYLTMGLGYSESGISILPSVTSLISLVMLLFITPYIKKKNAFLNAGLVVYILGTFFLVVTNSMNSIVFLSANVIFWSFSKSLVNIIVQTQLANEIEDVSRADIMGFINIISTICMLPAGIVGGFLYKNSPVYPFYFILIIYVAGLLLNISRLAGHSVPVTESMVRYRSLGIGEVTDIEEPGRHPPL